jgi:hypothetical protein
MAKKSALLSRLASLPETPLPKRPSWDETFAVRHPAEWEEIAAIVDRYLDGDLEVIRKLPSKKALFNFLEPTLNQFGRVVGDDGFFQMMTRREGRRGQTQ